MQSLKKILILQLLLLLVCNQLGYYFFYAFNQYKIKEEIKHQLAADLPENKLSVFCSDDRAIVWEDEEQELSFNGKMYDIARTKIINNKKYYYCLSDDEETALLKNYTDKCKTENDNTKQKKNKSNTFFQLVFLSTSENLNYNFHNAIHKNLYPFYSQESIDKVLATNYPPPKFL